MGRRGRRGIGAALIVAGLVLAVAGQGSATEDEGVALDTTPSTVADSGGPSTTTEVGSDDTTPTTAGEDAATTETTETTTLDEGGSGDGDGDGGDPSTATTAPGTSDEGSTTTLPDERPLVTLSSKPGDVAVLDPVTGRPDAGAAVVGDLDDDGVPDATDNCDLTVNSLQGDRDSDGLGNLCDPDFGDQDLVGGTIYENRDCYTISLVPNDDGSSDPSQKIFFPNALNFFGVEQRSAFVNNNGNLTFASALSQFTPFRITALSTPIIAPYFGDVDTRGIGGGRVRYGVALRAAAFGGRNVTCVTWDAVGYFASHVDRRNTFQVLIVERSDIAPGDFDIYFNYARIEWETGDASGGSGGLGGTSAGAGFSSGTGDPSGFFSLPCSLVNGACLDTNQTTGLRNTSTNSNIRGRHIFRVRSGGTTFRGAVAGTVELNDPPQPRQPNVNALVELCLREDDGTVSACRSTLTVANGSFEVSNLPPGDYRLRVFPGRIGGRNINPPRLPANFQPSGPGLDPLPVELEVQNLGDGERRVVDIDTTTGTPPPSGVTFGTFRNGSFFPHVVVGQPTVLTVNAPCPTDGTFEIFQDGRAVSAGVLRNQGQGRFTATITITTVGPIDVRVTFPGCNSFRFDGYIDPSGLVVDQDGTPIVGARVVLLRSDFPEGPFEQVPSGSEIMSPSNRDNPDVTDATGFFGWDTLSGFYRVDASAAGCTSGSTGVLPVPPEQVDLRIVLTCGTTATTATTTTDGEGALARTGSDVRAPGVAALLLVALGGGLVLTAARREDAALAARPMRHLRRS